MGWLRRLFRLTPKKELEGVELDTTQPFWELEGKTDFPRLLRALAALFPEDSILYFEDCSPNKELREFLKAHAIPEQTHVAVATLWPKPRYYHVPATRQVLADLAELMESRGAPELAIHFHVYREGRVLLQWHDTFLQTMLLSGDLPEEKVKRFAESLSMTTTKWKNAGEAEN